MSDIISTVLTSLDLLGLFLLCLTLLPIWKLMRELPNSAIRKRWIYLIVLILIFIGSYLFIAVGFRTGDLLIGREAISMVLLLGALFVFGVSTLSLQTTLDLKRIDSLEIENITDPLMGISNRRHLERKLNDELAKAKRYDLPLSILMIDVDHFKMVNDTYGHDAGDAILKNLGTFIANSIRKNDCVARYGGEELVIIYPDTHGKDAVLMGERLRQAIEEHVIVPPDMEKQDREIHITVSIGVAEDGPEISNIKDLIKRADKSMYRAKHEGRNRVLQYDGPTSDATLSAENQSATQKSG